MWVVWALGISSYNAYCIYDYYTTIQDFTVSSTYLTYIQSVLKCFAFFLTTTIFQGHRDDKHGPVLTKISKYVTFSPAFPSQTGCIEDSLFWDEFINQDYAYFFITVTTSVCCYGLLLLVSIPVASVITHMVRPGTEGDRRKG